MQASHPEGKPRGEQIILMTAEKESGLSQYDKLQLGVHQIISVPSSGPLANTKNISRRLHEVIETLPAIRWLVLEAYSMGPLFFVLYIASSMWLSIAPTLQFYLFKLLLQTLEHRLTPAEYNENYVWGIIALQAAHTIVGALLAKLKCRLCATMKGRTYYHLQQQIFRIELQRPYSSSHCGSDVGKRIRDLDGWDILDSLIGQVIDGFSAIADVLLLLQLAREHRLGTAFMLTWGVRVLPVFEDWTEFLWNRLLVYLATLAPYVRLCSITGLMKDEYRQELLSLNLGGYLLDEHASARKLLGDIPTGEPWEVIGALTSSTRDIVMALMDELPLLYCAVSATLGGGPFSLSVVTVARKASENVRWKLGMLFGSSTRPISRIITELKDLHTFLHPANTCLELSLPYPTAGSESSAGMCIELRDVSLQYPGKLSMQHALQHISLKITAGELVVIVGENGSGKSSLIKLLTGLYAPTSGKVLVDGQPLEHYRIADLREATTLLTQDLNLFPGLSLKEDVGLGRASHTSNVAAINEAVHQGGAEGVVAKLSSGLDTVLRPANTKGWINVPPGHPLFDVYEDLEKPHDISGGERQRLIAARTFMRMSTGSTPLVIVDEPSAAMDPAGEYHLFQQLLKERKGKTMIFITHRFGHLTKHADAIFCLKDGILTERGTHQDLIKLGGEYSRLYNIQASAFTSTD